MLCNWFIRIKILIFASTTIVCKHIALSCQYSKYMKFRFSVAFCIFSLSLMVGSLKSMAAIEWQLIADGNEKMPLKEVLYLLGSDASDRLTVVGSVRNIPDVAKVTFETGESSGILSPPICDILETIVCVDNVITVYNLSNSGNLRIYTTEGRLIHSTDLLVAGGKTEISIASFTPGIYIANINGRSVKIIKK